MLRESDNSMMAISEGNEFPLETSRRQMSDVPSFEAAVAQKKSSAAMVVSEAMSAWGSKVAHEQVLRASGETERNQTAGKLHTEHWGLLEKGLRQRFEAVSACLNQIFHQGILPDYLADCGFLKTQLESVFGCILGSSPTHAGWAWFGSTDIHITADGCLTVLDHNFSVPTGLELLTGGTGPSGATDFNRPLLTVPEQPEVAGVCVVLMPGVYSAANRGNEFLARCLNAQAARSADIAVRADGVYVHAGADRLRVSTIVRRIEDDLLDPNCFRPESLVGVPGLVRAWKNGLVNVVSPPGSSLANNRTFGKFIPQMIREFLGEEPLLPTASILECEDSQVLKHVLANLKDYAVRTNDPLHPARPFFGRHGMAVEFADLLKRLRKNPSAYVARPLLPEGAEAGMNLRCFASLDSSFRLLPCAIGRRCQPDGGASLSIGTGEEVVSIA
jgi:uncharacterized circularly permuted ATP-grasp superfamily protein